MNKQCHVMHKKLSKKSHPALLAFVVTQKAIILSMLFNVTLLARNYRWFCCFPQIRKKISNFVWKLSSTAIYIMRIFTIETYVIISRTCLISLLTPYPLAARWKVSGVISISEHRTTATVSKNSRNSASSSALK